MSTINHKTVNHHATHKSELIPGVSLTCIETDKFKTGCITVNLISTLSRETASVNALLPRVLRRGSAEHPDMERLAAALDDLYGARIEPIVRKKGELHCIGFYADFPDDRYIPGGESVLEKTVKMIGEILLSPSQGFSPVMQKELLRGDYVESEKSNLIDDIRAAINDKRGYSIDRLLEEMCRDEAFGISKLGSESETLKITAESLTAHYRKILACSKLELFYCGSAKPERVETALRSALQNLPERTVTELPKTNIVFDPVTSEPRRFNETLDVTQGKLTVGFRLGSAMKKPDFPAMIVFNAIYGGCVTSKLFLNVREKMSLCYYASSMLDKHKGVMLVASGVETSKFETALEEILRQLESVRNGEVSETEFTSAKRYVASSVKSALDRPGGLEELYFDSALTTVPYDPVELSQMVQDVTPERVANVASGIKTDSVYFLSGSQSESAEEEDCDEYD